MFPNSPLITRCRRHPLEDTDVVWHKANRRQVESFHLNHLGDTINTQYYINAICGMEPFNARTDMYAHNQKEPCYFCAKDPDTEKECEAIIPCEHCAETCARRARLKGD